MKPFSGPVSTALLKLVVELDLLACRSADVEGVVGSAEAIMLDDDSSSSNPKGPAHRSEAPVETKGCSNFH